MVYYEHRLYQLRGDNTFWLVGTKLDSRMEKCYILYTIRGK